MDVEGCLGGLVRLVGWLVGWLDGWLVGGVGLMKLEWWHIIIFIVF